MPGVDGSALPSSQYGALVGGGLAYAGVDQGIDFTGAGDVFALGDGIVTRVLRSGSGWPGEGAVLNYKIISGPAAGKYVYVAEDFAPASGLKVGSTVKQGQTIGKATGSGKAPGIEVGWALPSGSPVAPRPPARPADQYTPQGDSFRGFVTAAPTARGQWATDAISGVNHAVANAPVVKQINQTVGAIGTAGDFLGRITDPSYILRGLQIVAGAVLVLAGVVLLVRQVALAADLPDPVKAAAGSITRVPLPGTGRDIYQR